MTKPKSRKKRSDGLTRDERIHEVLPFDAKGAPVILDDIRKPVPRDEAMTLDEAPLRDEMPRDEGILPATPPGGVPPPKPKFLNLNDTTTLLRLLDKAEAQRLANEPRPLPRHWNGLNMRRS